MKRIRVLAIGLFISPWGGCLAGCTIHTRNHGEIGFEWGTHFKLIHRAEQTAPEEATAGVDAPAIVDWIVKPKPESKADTQPASPTPTGDADTGG